MRSVSKFSLLLIMVSLIWSCSKDETASQPETLINVSIKNTEVYNHDFKISGDEEGATIKIQARNCKSSEIIRNSSTNWNVVYQYTPDRNFRGTDYVIIETCTGGGGCGCSKIEMARINFTITD
jgi:hypothetical protein